MKILQSLKTNLNLQLNQKHNQNNFCKAVMNLQLNKFLETCSLSTHYSFSPCYDAGMFTFPGLSLEQ